MILIGLSLVLDANGIPVYAVGAGSWDLYLGGENLSMTTFGNNYVWVHLTYEAPAVPDAGTAFFLRAIALSGVLVRRSFVRGQP